MRKILCFLLSVLVGLNMFAMTTSASDIIVNENVLTNKDIIADMESVTEESTGGSSELINF